MPLVTFFTQRSVNISWAPPHDYHYSPILHYVIHVREGEKGHWDVSNGLMTLDNRTHFQVIGLKPFTTYSFRVLAVNAIGMGEPSPPSHFIITLRQVPDSLVTIIGARNVSSNAIKLDWLPPSAHTIHGEHLGYKIRYVHQYHEHQLANQTGAANGRHSRPGSALVQPSLDGPLAKEITVGDPGQTSFVIKGLSTYTPYKIGIQVSNPAGDGPSVEVLAMTDEGGKYRSPIRAC